MSTVSCTGTRGTPPTHSGLAGRIVGTAGEAGFISGTRECAAAATRYGDDRVVCLQMGGTSVRISVVAGGQVVTRPGRDHLGLPLDAEVPLMRSLALGGGSVAKPVLSEPALPCRPGEDRGRGIRVTLGPASMGAVPGPACFGLGGSEATLADAFLVCGLVLPASAPERGEGLSMRRARTAIAWQVGGPLGVPTETAAFAIVNAACEQVAGLVWETARQAGWDAAETTLYSYDFYGSLILTPVAERVGAQAVRVVSTTRSRKAL